MYMPLKSIWKNVEILDSKQSDASEHAHSIHGDDSIQNLQCCNVNEYTQCPKT